MSVLDVGATPRSESFLSADQLDLVEPTYPLHLRLCADCLLLQNPASPALTGDAIQKRGIGMSTDVEVGELADIAVADDVYDHMPDLRSFTQSLRSLIDDAGSLSIDVHHLLALTELGQFDAIHHERLQYFTMLSIGRALKTAGFAIVDVETLYRRRGFIRVWARPLSRAQPPSQRVTELLRREQEAGLHQVAGYAKLRRRSESLRHVLLRFLLDCHAEGKRVVGYGAPGKGGNTLLNYCGIRSDLLEYTVDDDPAKQGRFTSGTRIPIYEPNQIAEDRPDVVLALNWHCEAELTEQLARIPEWEGQLVFPLPTLHTAIPGSQAARR